MLHSQRVELMRIRVAGFYSLFTTAFFITLSILFRIVSKMHYDSIMIYILTPICMITAVVGIFTTVYFIGRYMITKTKSINKYRF